MNDKQWEQFFDLMNKIINQPGMTANEKIADFRARAEEYDAELEEFAGYMPCD